jgi:hypothetical protein
MRFSMPSLSVNRGAAARRSVAMVLVLTSAFAAGIGACVGDEPGSKSPGPDGGGPEASSPVDGATGTKADGGSSANGEAGGPGQGGDDAAIDTGVPSGDDGGTQLDSGNAADTSTPHEAGGGNDGGKNDGGTNDSGTTDSGTTDSGTNDSGTNDSGGTTHDSGSNNDGSSPVVDAGPCGAPCTLGGMVAWYRADFGVIPDGAGNVQKWLDQSGNGHDLFGAVTDAGTPPTLEAAGINGRDAVYFAEVAGVTQSPNIMSTAPFATLLAQPFTEFVAVVPTRAGVELWNITGGLTDAHNASLGYSYYSPMQSVLMNGGAELDPPNNSWYVFTPGFQQQIAGVWTGVFENSISELDINGIVRAQGTAGGNRLDGISIGSFPGYIGELLLYKGALSKADRATIEAYLKQRWGF